MNRKLMATALVAVFVSAGSGAAQQGHGHGHGDGMMQHCPMHQAMGAGPRAALQQRDGLGLSAEQVQRLEAAHARMHEAHQRVMPEMQEVHRVLGAAAAAEQWDEPAARGTLERAGRLHADMMLANLRAQHETRGILTAEQRERLTEHARHHGHGHGGGHGGPGMHEHGAGMTQCPMMRGDAAHGSETGSTHRH